MDLFLTNSKDHRLKFLFGLVFGQQQFIEACDAFREGVVFVFLGISYVEMPDSPPLAL